MSQNTQFVGCRLEVVPTVSFVCTVFKLLRSRLLTVVDLKWKFREVYFLRLSPSSLFILLSFLHSWLKFIGRAPLPP